jgi:hypothetical protein
VNPPLLAMAALLHCGLAAWDFVLLSCVRSQCTLLVLSCSHAAVAPCKHKNCITSCFLHEICGVLP